jgi:hypothetical protein
MLEFLKLHEGIFNGCDDSGGLIGDVFRDASCDLGKISENITHLSILEIVELVFSLHMDENYGIHEEVIYNFKNTLNNEGLDLLWSKFEQSSYEKDNYKIRSGLGAIADCKNDVDAFILSCSISGKPPTYDHLSIAGRLIANWRSKEALVWLDSMDTKGKDLWQKEKSKLKIQAYELEGNYAEAQNERLSQFERTLTPNLYFEIIKYAKPEFKERFALEAIEKAHRFSCPYTAIHFLTEIRELNEVAKIIRSKYDELSGRKYEVLRSAANALNIVDPIVATMIYRKMIQPILDETKTKYYNYAAKDLVTCGVLSSQITDWMRLKNHDEYFKEIEIDHKRKVRFWDEYKSALQKQASKQMKA